LFANTSLSGTSWIRFIGCIKFFLHDFANISLSFLPLRPVLRKLLSFFTRLRVA
jgi:hypothetical protein